MKPRKPAAPVERTETTRDAIRRVLEEGPASAKEISRAAQVREKDVAEHLEHLERSLKREGLKLRITPPSCLSCGFVFAERRRYTRPGACPECRGTRIDPPVFELIGTSGPKVSEEEE